MENFPAIPVALFARVSTNRQDAQRQIDDLQAYADRQGYRVVATELEAISGATKTTKRPHLQALLAAGAAGTIQKVLVTEISRLGRNTLEVLQVLERFTEVGVSVYVANYNLETLTAGRSPAAKKKNPMAQLMFTMLAEFARLERETLVERTISGMQAAKRKGKHIGRPRGSTKTKDQLLKEYPGVVRDLREGLSLRKIAKIREVSVDTVQKVKKLLAV
ncbi:Site-specific DNA recombinase [Catalinimonas alkaloidigena]|uniref:Site-specific DNA recombinase n=1 Tax=Catalinimonas alkaloidigena TaxID=1075417 RepID=A0A1G9B6D7_9BACT|nr:recombinase family protein [Catalinimonas alkaloidigena]SDK34435.1 Site-specific DNA recombinase [Catalinimonas alkaloidigena]